MPNTDKYRKILTGYLSLALILGYLEVSASGDQNLISLNTQSLGAGLGDTAPAIAYNSNSNEYLLIYSNKGSGCDPGNEQLFGIVVNAIDGNITGNTIPITACNESMRELNVYYNASLNEYFIFFKSIGAIGNKSNLYYCTLNGTTKDIDLSPTHLVGDAIADPFQDLTICYNSQINIYALGYHKTNAQNETSLTVDYIDGNSKTKKVYQTFFDKNDFASSNKGLTETKIIFNGSEFVVVFELKFDAGSEIWGGAINSTNGILVNDLFKISPTGDGSIFFSNPDAIYNSSTHEIITVYEESYFKDGGGAYILSNNIRLQKINATNGSLTSPANVAISDLPGSGNQQDKKFPTVQFSDRSSEIIIAFYGIRFAAGTDPYNLVLHRINSNNLNSLSTRSINVANSIGQEVLQNNLSKRLSLAHNSQNNQYNLVWIAESTNEVYTQIWRYDNNPPEIPVIATNSLNEELPVGYTFSTISASDPDPEDSTPTYALKSGIGGEDNSFFQITGDKLKIAKRLSFEVQSTRNLRISATDSHGALAERSFVISINDINEDPFALNLGGTLVVEENTTPGAFTSPISVHDDDLGNFHTYSLVPGDSSTNNSNFRINNATDILELTGSLNFEDTSRQYVRIRATDNTGLSTEKAFMLSITDVNEEPQDIILSTNSLPENDIESAAVVDVIDPDKYSNYSFSKSSGEGDDDNDHFNLVDNQLKPSFPLDYESKNSYKVRLRAFDGTYDKIKSFTISVTDKNDLPDSIFLSERQFLADQSNGALVGLLTAHDQDIDDTHTFSLLDGFEFFFINGTEIRALSSMSYDFTNPQNNRYTIEVLATDSQGGTKTQTLTIEVVLVKDEEKPQIRGFENIARYVVWESDSLTLAVDARDNEKLESVYFFYRPIRASSEFINGNEFMEVNVYDQRNYGIAVTLSTSLLDEIGLEYFFMAMDAAGNIDSTSHGHTYWSFHPKMFAAVNNSNFNGAAESYKILANPYLLESNKVSKIFSDFGSSSHNTWRLFNYSSNENKEIGTVNGSILEQGHGYWFNKTRNINRQILFENAKINENNQLNPYQMALRKGWNLIGNPYPFQLDWNYVIAQNAHLISKLDLYTFNKSYRLSTKLNEFEGGFVFAEQAMTLEIPVTDPEYSGARIAQNKSPETEWTLNLILDNGRVTNQLSGLGMHDEADESFDQFDRPQLPRFIDYLDISFYHPEHFVKNLAQDIVPTQESYIWEFIVSTNQSTKPITLSWKKPESSALTKQLILYNVMDDQVLDIKKESKYEFVADHELAFKVIYGDQSFIEQSLERIKVEAFKPYPNPFTNQVRIPINLPPSSMSYDLQCSIFNLLGEKVFVQNYESLNSGLFHLEWDTAKNRHIEQGIYIYSIKVNNGLLTNNFHGRIVKN